jgi:hypothetical protein
MVSYDRLVKGATATIGCRQSQKILLFGLCYALVALRARQGLAVRAASIVACWISCR